MVEDGAWGIDRARKTTTASCICSKVVLEGRGALHPALKLHADNATSSHQSHGQPPSYPAILSTGSSGSGVSSAGGAGTRFQTPSVLSAENEQKHTGVNARASVPMYPLSPMPRGGIPQNKPWSVRYCSCCQVNRHFCTVGDSLAVVDRAILAGKALANDLPRGCPFPNTQTQQFPDFEMSIYSGF